MKRITDSLLKRIVRQSLNESYGLLNEKTYSEEATKGKCPKGGFCIGDKLKAYVDGIKNSGGSYLDKLYQIGNMCENSLMGEPTFNDSTTSQYADKLFELLNHPHSNVEEDQVKIQMIKIGNFPNFCAIKQIFKEHTGVDLIYDQPGGLRSVNYSANATLNSENEDLQTYVLVPLVDLINKSLDITEKQKTVKQEEERINKEKKDNEEKTLNDTLLVNAKKCGYDSVEAYKNSGWKCEGPKFSAGGGGSAANQVSFKGYECIVTHPALINTPIQIPMGVGYKLDTGNKTIDSFIFGVSNTGPGNPPTDTGVIIKEGTGIPLDFSCETNKYIQFSLSTNAWSYDAIVPYMNPEYFNWSVPNNQQGKIVLTTDPDFEDDGKSNNSLQKENIKGFRHNLLTEAEYKVGSKGPEVGVIQKKLGLPADKGTPTYGPKTKAAVETFQSNNGLTVTGIVDDETYTKIMEIQDPIEPSSTNFTRELTLKSTGPDVVAIQTKLGISTKGGYGPETQRAVLAIQKKYTDLDDTGIVDEKTFKKIMEIPEGGATTTTKYSGRKHNFTQNDLNKWIKVSPNTTDEQLSGNDGYFRIINILNEYNIVIDAEYKNVGGGGSTQKVLFGEDAKEGTDQVISGTGGEGGTGGTGGTGGRGRRSGVVGGGGGGGTVDPERQRQRDLRKKEMCDALRQVKQYLNNTKDAGLTVNCQRDQNTLNQIMMALTGESPAPTQDSSVNTQPIPVTDKLF